MIALRNRFASAATLAFPFLIFAMPVVVFGSVWGEEVNHVWYSLGAGSSQSGLVPLSANNFGKVLVFGNPVYDFSIAAGSRLPLQTGASATVFVLLRHILSTEAIAVLVVLLLVFFSLVVLNYSLSVLEVSGTWLRIGILTAYVSVPTYLVTAFDWYSNSAGYVGMSTMLSVLVLVLQPQRAFCTHPRSNLHISLGLGVAFVAFASSYISYFHVSMLGVIAASIAARRHIVVAVASLLRRSIVLLPMAAVSCLTLILTIWDLFEAGRPQSELTRKTYETTLVSPLGGVPSIKHLTLQIVTGDWRGLVGVLHRNAILKYATATTPITLFISTVVICVVAALFVSAKSLRRKRLNTVDTFLILCVVGGIIGLWWTPLPKSIDVSDRNFYSHLVMICSLLIIARLSGWIRRGLGDGQNLKRVPSMLWTCFTVIFVANSLLVVPVALRSTLEAREVLAAPSSITSMIRLIGQPQLSSGLLTNIERNQRLMSLTEAFDAQKYFQTSYEEYVSYNDLTAIELPTINSYPKIRNATNISKASRFSSSLAPSSLHVDVARHCPIPAIRFLAVKTLVLSAQQRFHCAPDLGNTESMKQINLGTRDGIILSAVEFFDQPSYWAKLTTDSNDRCPILDRRCWAMLAWDVDESSRMQLLIDDNDDSQSIVRVSMSGVPKTDSWLVLPLAYDTQLRVIETGRDNALRVKSVNGFAAVQPSWSDVPIVLRISVSPDMRMYAYGLLPYAWASAFVLSGLLWWRIPRRVRTTQTSQI